jgi:uncharacterized protein (DUF2141 family)
MMVMTRALACLVVALATSARAATVDVQISGVTPGRGNVQVALCTSALEMERCQRTQTTAATGASVRVSFGDVAPGRYAVAVYQDLDGTGVIRRGKLGIPLEPYGFSNGAGLSHRPKFDAAAFDVGDGVRLVNIALRRINQRPEVEE